MKILNFEKFKFCVKICERANLSYEGDIMVY